MPTSGTTWRSRLLLLGALSLWSGPAVAEDAGEKGPPATELRASMTCLPAAEPGRVRCEVEARVVGAALRWVDVELTQVPEMATPLRGRIGPREATLSEPQLWRFLLAIVARKGGTGALAGRVRAVACRDDGACVPLVAEVHAELRVGR